MCRAGCSPRAGKRSYRESLGGVFGSVPVVLVLGLLLGSVPVRAGSRTRRQILGRLLTRECVPVEGGVGLLPMEMSRF